jgi:AbrB family looped-hinge helix DNA binding protein
METTRISTKGQIILPKSLRVARAWGPGTEFTVEETGNGILLRPTTRFQRAFR